MFKPNETFLFARNLLNVERDWICPRFRKSRTINSTLLFFRRKFIFHPPRRQTILIPRKRSSICIDHSPAFCSLKFYFAQGKQQIMLESSTSSPPPQPHACCAYTRRFHYPLCSSSTSTSTHPSSVPLATLFFLVLLMELLHKLFALGRGLSLFSA